MTEYRTDEYVLEVGLQSALSTEVSTTEYMALKSIDVSSVRHAEIEDERYVVDGGARESTKGVAYTEGPVPLSVVSEGIGSAVGDGASPSHTALTRLMGSVCQSTPDEFDGAAATGTPTTTSVTEGTAGAHEPAAVDGKTALGLALFEDIGVGAFTYSTATMTMLTALDSAPSATDLVYGGIGGQQSMNWDSPQPYALSALAIGPAAIMNRALVGAVARLSIPEIGAGEVQGLDFNLQFADIRRGFADTQQTPTVTRAKVLAGGELKLGVFGQTAMSKPCHGRLSAEVRPDGYLDLACPNEDTGIGLWLPSKASGSVGITVPTSFAPSDMTGATASSWYDQWEDGDLRFHLLYSVGQKVAGRTIAFYWPELVLMRPDDNEVNEHAARRLMFRPAADSDYAPFVWLVT